MAAGHQAVELTNNSDGVRVHDMGCSIDATGSEAVKTVNDFVGAQGIETIAAPGINATSSDAVGSTNDIGCVRAHNTNMAHYLQAVEPLKNATGVADHITG
jgi:hypothetical protein